MMNRASINTHAMMLWATAATVGGPVLVAGHYVPRQSRQIDGFQVDLLLL